MEKDNQFNYLNFFYGLGAAIILVAAMFKFLGWRYANEVFIVGVIVEAIVFLISAFDWTSSDRNYRWERVFPQLNDDSTDSDINLSMLEGTQQQQIQKIMETLVNLNRSVNELNAATKKLTDSVGTMEDNYESIAKSTKRYQQELDHLSAKISRANDSLRTLENFNYQRKKLD